MPKLFPTLRTVYITRLDVQGEGKGGWNMSLQLHSTFAAFTVEEIPPLPGWRLQRRHVLDGFHTIGPYFTIAFVIIGWRREKESP